MKIIYNTRLLNSFLQAMDKNVIEDYLGQRVEDVTTLDREDKKDIFMTYTCFKAYYDKDYKGVIE